MQITSVPFFDSRRSQTPDKAAMVAAFARVIDSGALILGPEVAKFEQAFAAACGCTHAVGVADGTDAIVLLLKALGIGEGDEVIVPAQSASASAMAVLIAGATIVFGDIDPVTNTLDPEACRRLITPRTRAVLAVHLYGHCADLGALGEICTANGIHLVEDCAQAHGATWQGRPVGSIGVGGAFSFYPTKNLGALGDGGAIVTNDSSLYERLLRLRQYGWEPRFRSDSFGYNSRLDEVQAALLSLKLPHLADSVRRRRELAAAYVRELNGTGLTLPPASNEHAYHLFVVRHPDRDGLRKALKERGIDTGVHYTWALTDQPAFSAARNYGACPNAYANSQEVLSLPLFPDLRMEEVEYVCKAVRELS